jgi:hypothetical protein
VTYLDERVQRLSIEPLEVSPDVQHVNLCSGNHHSNEGAVISAQTLKKKMGSHVGKAARFQIMFFPNLARQNDG